ncbi:MAG: inositol 2-dehydrogenase [Chloroflexi bacterium]|jgi:myo-inositol 2-dehydrogenase/D-chiro-inositol 1-dehydrogenase|nr:inositol 2-dehydrogenase [Chloroflexota bacterium]
MSKLNIGLIGAGRIGQVHAATIAYRVNSAQLAAVTDPIASAAQAVAGKFRIPTIANSYKDIISDPNIDAVMICTPTDTHAEIIQAAAAAGKHIFCEKPVALDLAQTDAAVNAAERAGVKLQLGFNRRFDANYARVRQAIVSGEVGDVRMVHIISRDPAPPPISYVKVSGGIFLDMTIHDWDMARFLTGSEIEEVYVQGGIRVDPAIGEAGDIDTHVTLLRFANGAIGTIDNCRQAVYGYDQRVEVFGSKGVINTQNNYANNSVLSTAQSVYRDLPLNFFMTRYTEAYAAEVEAFVASVVNNTPVVVSGQDGRAALLVGLAAKRSYAEHRPVRVNE